MAIVRLDVVLAIDIFDGVLVVMVELPQLLLQPTFVLVEIDQVLLDEGLDVYLHVVGCNRIVILCSVCRQRRQAFYLLLLLKVPSSLLLYRATLFVILV